LTGPRRCTVCNAELRAKDLPATESLPAVRAYVPHCPWCGVVICLDCRCPRPRTRPTKDHAMARWNGMYIELVGGEEAERA